MQKQDVTLAAGDSALIYKLVELQDIRCLTSTLTVHGQFFKSDICTLKTGPGLAAKLFVMSQIVFVGPPPTTRETVPSVLLLHQFVCRVKEMFKMKFKPAFSVSL